MTPICYDQLLSISYKVTLVYCYWGIFENPESNSARDNYDQIKDVFNSTRVAGHVASSLSSHDNADGGIFRHGYRLERDCYTNISFHCAWTYSGTVSRNCACDNLRRHKCYRSQTSSLCYRHQGAAGSIDGSRSSDSSA